MSFVVARHLDQAQFFAAIFGQRQADQTTAMFGHEINGVRRDVLGSHDQVAFILAVFFIDQNDHAACLQFGNDLSGSSYGGMGWHENPKTNEKEGYFLRNHPRAPNFNVLLVLRRVGFDLNSQAHIVTNKWQTVLQAKLGAAQHALSISATTTLAQGQIEAALEATDLKSHRPELTEHEQRPVDRNQPLLIENQVLAAKQNIGKDLGIEPGFTAQYLVAQLKASVQRGGINTDIDPPATRLAVEVYAAAGAIELTTLR